MHPRPKKNPSNLRRNIILIGTTILLVVVLGLVLWVVRSKPTVHPTANQETKGEPKASTSTPSASTNPPAPGASKDTGNANQTTLLAPTGDFVSDHHPNLSGTPHPSLMTSTCTTTPGATCQITFTKGSVVKKLSSETTDAGGSAYWNWDLNDIGLSSGSWQIQAIVKLGNQTKSTTDALALEVSP